MVTKLLALSISILLAFLSSPHALASHVGGGDLSYRYIGDSTGIPYQYEITLKLYRKEASGAAITPDSLFVDINSSCFPGTLGVMLYKKFPVSGGTANGGQFFPDYLNCGDISPMGIVEFGIYTFNNVVSLPGKCLDFNFTFTLCCRAPDIDNMSTPGNESFTIEAWLNNLNGPNDSPQFNDPPVYSYCLNKPAFSFHPVRDADGDSLVFKLISAIGSSGDTVNYSPGFSYLHPVPSSVSITFGPNSGTMTFTPDEVGLYTIVVSVNEYRWDPLFGIAILAGQMMREFNVTITSNCVQSYDQHVFGDSTSSNIIGGIACGDTIIDIDIDPVLRSSVAADGSDFQIRNSKGSILPILQAGSYVNGKSAVTEKIWLHMYAPILYNDTLIITTHVGSDTNTLINMCGDSFPSKEEALIVVNDCQGWVSIGEERITAPEIRFYPNPADEVLNVRYSQAFPPENINVYDLRGNLLISTTRVANTIDVGMLAKGIYILVADFPSQRVVKRIMVE